MLWLRVLALFGVGALAGLGANAARSNGVPLRTFQAPVSCEEHPAAAGARTLIAPGEAASLCGQADVMIADVRPAEAFAQGHVAGAVHLPCSASGSRATDGLSALGAAATVIVYGDSTAEAQPVAEALALRRARGDQRILVLDGGFPAWSQEGLACASGPCDHCEAEGPR